MSELWKEIFHDSDDYIRLILNEETDLDNCAYRYNDVGTMTSMIVGIPYTFDGSKQRYRALYLCGVSTLPEMRGKGEIQHLMADLEKRAEDRNYNFTFLIPANEKLRHFYKKYNYHDMAYAMPYSAILQFENSPSTGYIQEHISSIEDIKLVIPDNDRFNIIDITELYGEDYKNFVISAYHLLQNIEQGSGDIFLRHTIEQWELVCQEWIMSGNKIYVILDSNITQSEYPKMTEQEKSKLIRGVVFLKNDLADLTLIDSLTPRPYGMIKSLSRNIPDATQFGITFMMD